jgi:thioredoxin-dependent peroxiredoxin
VTRVRVGDPAPDFTAPGTGGRDYSLHDYKGQPVVLVFYPGDATPVCTAQLKSYTENFESLNELGAVTLALSPQDVASHEAFHSEHNFAFPLLYDEDKKIGRMYGVVGTVGFYKRSIFVIDADGNIAYARRSSAGLTYPSAEHIAKAVKAAQKS